MNSQHTPAPWECEYEDGRYVITHDLPMGKAAIAFTGGSYPTNIHNARLLKSAPVMLAALQMQQSAELGRSECDWCEGEGDWVECSKCSVEFGNAIDARHAALISADPNWQLRKMTALDGGVEQSIERSPPEFYSRGNMANLA